MIAQSVKNLLEGDIAVPHAIEQDGHLVQVYDPVIHEARPTLVADDLDTGDPPDGRWLRCRRPLVTVGGELVMDALELAYDETSGFYRSPIQLAANGGVLVIDDFGRQRCSVVELLNRWISPLESRTDFLTLTSGQKLPVPFVVLVVFATNIKPVDLVDEAFLRRIHYKVFAENPTVAEFKEIFSRCCRERDIDYDEAVVERLVTGYLRWPAHCAAWLPAARSHRSHPGPRRLPRRGATAHRHSLARRLRELLPRRPGASTGCGCCLAGDRSRASSWRRPCGR